jgi:cytoskeletal protein CcmA (bactofilin family)
MKTNRLRGPKIVRNLHLNGNLIVTLKLLVNVLYLQAVKQSILSPCFTRAACSLFHAAQPRLKSNLKPVDEKEGRAVSTQAVARSDERAARGNKIQDNWLGFVGDVSTFSGEVSFKSMLRIDGQFSGNVNSQDGTLIVSAGARLTKATINVAVAKINGTVEGDIHVSKELVLGRTASVTGHLFAPALVVEEGALFNGSCRQA